MRVKLYQLPDTGYAHLDRDWKTNDELPTHGETADGKFYLVDVAKAAWWSNAFPKFMFVEKSKVEEVKNAVVDALAFPTDMTNYTKGTRSQYGALGADMVWPLNVKFDMINSPFGPRSADNPDKNKKIHAGVDVSKNGRMNSSSGSTTDETKLYTIGNNGNVTSETVAKMYYKDYSEIDNEIQLVAVYDGVVKEAGYHVSMGNYISIEINKRDPKTNNKLRVTYMHMKYRTPFLNSSNKLIDPGTGKETSSPPVKKGQQVGYLGNTGHSSGAHLHIQFCNDGTIGKKADYMAKNLINPLYFYPGMKFVKNAKTGTYPTGTQYDHLAWEYDPKYLK